MEITPDDVIRKIATAVRTLPVAEGYAGEMPRALLVGGYVRDGLLGIRSKDVDIEVFGVEADSLEEAMKDMFPGRVNVVGRTFGVLKIAFHLPRSVSGSASVPDTDRYYDIDVSIPRRESKVGRGHTGFAVTGDPTMSFRDAARRRDFTMNAISADPLSGEIIDPFNGQHDLTNRILRVVDPSTFPDDPLRVYRAIQFTARFRLTVEPTTRELLTHMINRGDLEELSKERVADEVKKLLLKADRPSIGFHLARELGLITRCYPELDVLKETEQEPEWHPEGDVWVHTLMVLDRAATIIRDTDRGLSPEDALAVMLGSLCHDIGKPATTRIVGGRIRSRGHSEAGLEPTETFLGRFAFSHDVNRAVRVHVKEHLIPGMLAMAHDRGELSDEKYANAVRKLIRRIHPVPIEALLAVAEADFRGRTYPTADELVFLFGKKMRDVISASGLGVQAIQTLIQGRDLLALGVPEGPRIGELIREVEAARDRGDVKTRDEALDYVKRRAGSPVSG